MAARLCSNCDQLIRDGRLCVRCRHNRGRRATAVPAPASQTTLVYGPPCAGKNFYVEKHAAPGHLVVDFDAIITALGGPGGHDQPDALKPFAFDCVDAVMKRLSTGDHVAERVWVIKSAPTRADRLPFRHAELVALVPAPEVCHERAERERPPQWHQFIDDWFAKYEEA